MSKVSLMASSVGRISLFFHIKPPKGSINGTNFRQEASRYRRKDNRIRSNIQEQGRDRFQRQKRNGARKIYLFVAGGERTRHTEVGQRSEQKRKEEMVLASRHHSFMY